MDSKDFTYLVVESSDAFQLARKVNEMLISGWWELLGEPFAGGDRVYQEMTKRSEEKGTLKHVV